MPKERWKPVVGFPYEVSNQGHVRSLPRKLPAGGRGPKSVRGRVLKGRSNAKGHLRVQLCGDGVVQDFLIRRLVATYFSGALLGRSAEEAVSKTRSRSMPTRTPIS